MVSVCHTPLNALFPLGYGYIYATPRKSEPVYAHKSNLYITYLSMDGKTHVTVRISANSFKTS